VGRRVRSDKLDWRLPWQIELALCFWGLICVPIGMWWFTNEITSPATMLGEMFNVPVDTQRFIEPFESMVLVFGVLVGWRVRCWLRRALVDRLNRIV
jgi:hypothetical protein